VTEKQIPKFNDVNVKKGIVMKLTTLCLLYPFPLFSFFPLFSKIPKIPVIPRNAVGVMWGPSIKKQIFLKFSKFTFITEIF